MSDFDELKRKYGMRRADPAPLGEHPVDAPDPQYTDLQGIDFWKAMKDRIARFILKRLKESNTWLGAVLALLSIPPAIQDPIIEVVAAAAAILCALLWPEGREEAKEVKGSTS